MYMIRALLVALSALALTASVAEGQIVREQTSWRSTFDSADATGVFALRRIGSDTVHTSDAARAERRFLPASTFKIPNSLLALELGIVRDEYHPFPFTWPRAEIASWNRDHTFRTALKYSVVPAYQQIARQVGAERYRDWLARLDYGNADPSGGLETFWLDGNLRISALEQIAFLDRFAQLQLPLSERSQRIVHAMLVVEANACFVTRAKTGLIGVSATREVEPVGWYVGWIETDAARWLFALNLDVRKPGDPALRQRITRELLVRAGIIPERCGS
jgi:beta-lactamase class D